ncbi:MAG TPA: AP2 domain-containing protein [Anaerolineae bacterium]|nr:AP2 domain-containing protein [Anaerolineae bacterium]
MTTQIQLTKGMIAFVDDEDSDLADLKWHVIKTYAVRGSPHNRVFMHRVILERKLKRRLRSGEHSDHINGNGFDNRRSNLRAATAVENGQNRKVSSNNRSGFKGVYWNRCAQKWHAKIKHGGRNIHLGYFNTPAEAARAYDTAAVDLYGEFARPNFRQGLN